MVPGSSSAESLFASGSLLPDLHHPVSGAMFWQNWYTCLLAFYAGTTYAACPSGASAQNSSIGGFEYQYPWPIHYHEVVSQQQQLCQAYMDVAPPTQYHNDTPTSTKTAVLLHGKNFCGVTWEVTARELLAQGYRVILPDRIGFCKISKPDWYQFSLQQLAANTKDILDHLNVTGGVTVIGHSMGGMLAARFTLMYPALVSQLVLVNLLGLEDWKAKGVPYRSIDAIYATELATNYTSLRTYQQRTYYSGTWQPAYDVWVNMLLQVYQGTRRLTFAFSQALTTDMVMTQPIVYELPLLGGTRTLLLIGLTDNTAIGSAWSPPEVPAQLGHYDVLGKAAKNSIGENCTLIEFDDLGHAPQIQAPERFHEALLGWLG
ncbi:4,5:9,10-diseco-3-hydroxy-5,9,17-trioxoandrosta-1(10),2-diene-4-oate hydrolase [Fulvia fulva]|nr:4,5:9,10-diseco-3-hydroxy-5,9,17-trioxoandrosta-1(10),2-diene-4-oate hydrolase [Fulvia fulva]KAK4634004.1 4,5:9,10-diseco-3-hydroxy-5,9,17-trioxoandrosta-1(10),2-diene-4-oate hydrolase [Fulvia fulva]WPV11613.1 4,5:9,10-diseco-3-hydroxy-5,9,17-trioxoandrosta-1(10),2-diene-4-oate hydrolase [Fulvia fulva]WPV26472.1 4,5:9,10-diseco-3-hydroxy-5,9,17-trioxoandrosta-1(10),2-diene-4-oate hydrolase [Fulvia fulva]